MTNIQFLKDRIIIDGHADTKQECETITLLCDNLVKSKDFKTVRYESGYAEFEKVGKANDLKFAAANNNLTWVINETPKLAPITGSQKTWDIHFKSNNGNEYIKFNIQNTGDPDYIDDAILMYIGTGGNAIAYSPADGGWENNNFKTVEFTETIPNDLQEWLNANATQGSSTTGQQIDLSTLSGWANLSNGEHSITVKVKASGYADSAASNAVTVTKGAIGGYTVNFSNDLGDDLPSYGKFEYSLDGSTWNTILEWHSNDGTKPPLQVTTLSNVSTIKFRITGAAAEPGFYLSMVGGVVGSTTKLFSIETTYSSSTDPVATTDMLILEDNINVSISSRFSIG